MANKYVGTEAQRLASTKTPAIGEVGYTERGLYVGDGRTVGAALPALTTNGETGTRYMWDDFADAADGPIPGRVSPSGHTWLAESGQAVATIVSHKLRSDATAGVPSSSAYPTLDLGFTPTWFRMRCDYDFIGGNDGSQTGGATMVNCSTPDLGNNVANPAHLLHFSHGYSRYDLGVSAFYPQDPLHSLSSFTYTKNVMATVTSGSAAVVAVAGTFDLTEAPVTVTGAGVQANSTLTYVDDTHATLSATATASGTVLLSINSPERTDGSVTYSLEMIANAETNVVSVKIGNDSWIRVKVVPRVAPATLTSGSPTVLDTAIKSTDVGKLVVGTGIPANTYVGIVTPLTSYQLTSSRASQVDVNATASGSHVLTVGEPLANYMHRYFIWEPARNSNTAAPFARFHRVEVWARGDNAQPGLWEQLGKQLGGDVFANRTQFYQVKMGKVATTTSSGPLPGVAFGTAEDAYLYRLGANKIATDGLFQASALGLLRSGSITASKTLDPIADGFALCNGTSITVTLPAANTGPAQMFFIKNINATPLTIQAGGSDRFDRSSDTSLVLRWGDSVVLIGNGNDTWFPNGGYQPRMALNGVPTLAAGSNNGTGAPTPTLVAGGSDYCGVVQYGSGASPALGEQVVVTLSAALPVVPRGLLLMWEGSNISNSLSYFGPDTSGANKLSTTGFSIRSGSAPTASQSVGFYRVYFELRF